MSSVALSTDRRHVVTESLVNLYKPKARRWIDVTIGVNVDNEVTDREIEALAVAFAEVFVEGLNAAPHRVGEGKEGSDGT